MDQPRIRLGDDEASSWLELAQQGEDDWRVTAEWCSTFTADYSALLTTEEAADFAERMLAGLASGARFRAAVMPGRNNPLQLVAEPAGDGYAFYARLTPDGDDEVGRLQMDIGPVDTRELLALFAEFHASLA
ncbi:hypothetical protein ACFVXG_33740 [Kitasatospora sp. NPDC058162]|uniref:hypothetical protein n=1 Tax=Kitasatospora sp. NPDC058162 TaxID=3346362 RepID=UPI0036D869B6